MHQAEVRTGRGDDLCKPGVAAQRRDVVDELGAELDGTPRDLGLGGVDRNRDAVELLEDGNDAAQLFVDRDGIGARPCRLSADVDDCGALLDHAVRGNDGVLGPEVDSSVRERVRRDVDDAHHAGAGEAFLQRPAHVASVIGEGPGGGGVRPGPSEGAAQ